MQKGYVQLEEYLRGKPDCQPLIPDFHSDAQNGGNSMRDGRIRGREKKPPARLFHEENGR
jgi:hypothetical protein